MAKIRALHRKDPLHWIQVITRMAANDPMAAMEELDKVVDKFGPAIAGTDAGRFSYLLGVLQGALIRELDPNVLRTTVQELVEMNLNADWEDKH